MPTLMIVDDEETIRQGLALAIRRLAPSWEIVSKLEDGLEAVKALEMYQPDLMIVDISMPGMNGLELTRYVSENYKDVHQIVLSGHDNFSYVQSALRSGVADYLLKPLDRQELVEALAKIERKIEGRKEEEKERSTSRRMQLEKALADWLSGETVTRGRVEEILREHGWGIKGVGFAVVALMETPDGRFPGGDRIESLQTGFWTKFGQIHHLIGWEPAPRHRILLLEGKEMPIEAMRSYWSEEAGVGISESFESFEAIPEAYRRTMEAAYAAGGGYGAGADLTLMLEKSKELADTARSRQFEQEMPWLLARIAAPLKPGSIADALSEFARKIESGGLDAQKADSRKVVRLAKDYIHANFADPELSLEQVAHNVYLNANYLSELFKQVTGDNFIDYLTRTRMAAAKKLLKETHLKTYEITEQVGYTSAKYFSTLFRKLCGMTPTEYRNLP